LISYEVYHNTSNQVAKFSVPLQHNAGFRSELQQQGGKVTVPCLQITPDNAETGQVQWLYESKDIIAYLQQRFAA
ncbi:glutathione S-transferase N-terminal domain-containing protein, partial [Alishewanella tabrizica]|uniref:glutathione S-transferase N-terminal domain-containing protein n=1 Tax=Alishewanella tabrizica TaxID=671278 RepID=UPI00167C3588